MIASRAPHWSLKQVKKALAQGGLELTERRAVDPLIQHEASVVDRSSALAHVKPIIDTLKGTDFSHTVQAMQNVSDVYGIQIGGRDWWVKLTLQEVVNTPTGSAGATKTRQVLVISFHPPEREFKTVGGLELKPW